MNDRKIKNQIITVVVVAVAIYLAIKILPFFLGAILAPIKFIIIIALIVAAYIFYTRWRND